MSIEAIVRDYLRSQTSVMSKLNNDPARANIEWTGNTKATHLTIYQAGGTYHDYVPHEVSVVTIHCYGSTRSVAAELAQSVAIAIRGISQVNEPLRSASVESVSYVPADDGTARYAVITSVTARMATA